MDKHRGSPVVTVVTVVTVITVITVVVIESVSGFSQLSIQQRHSPFD
jgi:type II secretory pathway component PulK